MNPHGRKAEEKLWETKFRHSFFTNYLQDPDLHVLLFVSEARINDILREALRDYMAKHSHKAADPDFQSKVFMAASLRVARGQRPVGSEVMADIGEQASASTPAAPTRQASPRKTPPTPTAPPAQVIGGADQIPPQDEEAPSPAPVEQAQSTGPGPQSTPAVPEGAPSASRKAVVDLDFGGADLPANDVQAEPPKPSLREQWLARHR